MSIDPRDIHAYNRRRHRELSDEIARLVVRNALTRQVKVKKGKAPCPATT